jgi:hypothetical protein
MVFSAWLATLLASALPEILLHELGIAAPDWLVWLKLGALGALLILSLIWKRIRPLSPFFVVLFALLFGTWIMDRFQSTAFFKSWERGSSYAGGMSAFMLIELVFALVMIAVLLLLGYRRKDFFFARGTSRAKAERVRWLGMDKSIPWKEFGPIVIIIAAVVLSIFLILFNRPSQAFWPKALKVLPLAVLLAAINAFNEETIWRSAFLAPLHSSVGRNPALLMNAAIFGLAHYLSGSPGGIPGLVLTGFLGYLMAKAMLETRGFFWPWLIHFISDIPVLVFIAAASY